MHTMHIMHMPLGMKLGGSKTSVSKKRTLGHLDSEKEINDYDHYYSYGATIIPPLSLKIRLAFSHLKESRLT